MGNMSYCRFENTVGDLRDCADHLLDDLSESEEQARERLIRICSEIVEEAKRNDLPPFDNQDDEDDDD